MADPQKDPARIRSFCDAVQKAISPECLLLPGSPEFSRYASTTLPNHRGVPAVVRASSTDEVQRIVKIAGDCQTPLYTISKGNNWGYGCALPVQADTVVLDLGAMNRILEVNRELAYVVVEPGVTQGELYAHLRERGIPLLVDITGAGPEASVLGNAVERGYGVGLYSDHFASMCGMEVVLPNGELLRTGFGRFETARAVHTYKWGVGPFLDGIFTQSNFGIVTKIGVWLHPSPENLEVCFAQSDDPDGIYRITELVRRLQLEETVRTRINVLSRNRAIAMYRPFPWAEAESQPMSEDLANRIAGAHSIAHWNVMFALFGTQAQIAASKKRVRQLLEPACSSLVFGSKQSISMMERAQRLPAWLRPASCRHATLLRHVLAAYTGDPDAGKLQLAYFRNRSKQPTAQGMNPATDGCGIVWFAPVLPMESASLKDFIAFSSAICRKFDVYYAPTFTSVTSRSFDCSLPLLYDKENHEEAQRLSDCYFELVREGKQRGFIPYRLGIQSMEELNDSGNPYWAVVESIKSALDPKSILAPGRYHCRR